MATSYKACLLGQCSHDSTLPQDPLSSHPPNVTVPKMRQTRTPCRCQQEGQRWALRLCANPACTAHGGFWKVLIPAAASSVNGASDASSPVLVYVCCSSAASLAPAPHSAGQGRSRLRFLLHVTLLPVPGTPSFAPGLQDCTELLFSQRSTNLYVLPLNFAL